MVARFDAAHMAAEVDEARQPEAEMARQAKKELRDEKKANRKEKRAEKKANVVVAALACVLFLGSCLLALVDIYPKTPNGMPLLSVVGIVFSIALAIFAVRKLFKK